MENYVIFEPQDLLRVGVICPACKTEVIFDLSRDQAANVEANCPSCNRDLVGVFSRNKTYSLATWFKETSEHRLPGAKEDSGIRLYFRARQPNQSE